MRFICGIHDSRAAVPSLRLHRSEGSPSPMVAPDVIALEPASLGRLAQGSAGRNALEISRLSSAIGPACRAAARWRSSICG